MIDNTMEEVENEAGSYDEPEDNAEDARGEGGPYEGAEPYPEHDEDEPELEFEEIDDEPAEDDLEDAGDDAEPGAREADDDPIR